VGDVLTIADLNALAAPLCRECGAPVQRVEHVWHLDEDGIWRVVAATVCARGHRVIVEPAGD